MLAAEVGLQGPHSRGASGKRAYHELIWALAANGILSRIATSWTVLAAAHFEGRFSAAIGLVLRSAAAFDGTTVEL